MSNRVFGPDVLCRALSVASLSMLVAVVAPAHADDRITLNQVLPVTLPNNDTELRLVFSGPPPTPQAYQIERPARLVLDLPATRSGLADRVQNLDSSMARTLTVIDNQDITRLVVGLSQTGGYTTRIDGNTLVLRMSPTLPVQGVSVAAPSQMVVTAPVAVVQPVVGRKALSEISDVDFRRGSAGDGQVIVGLNTANVPVDVQQQGTRIIARFLGTKVPERLRRRMDVNDFATPIRVIDAYNEGSNGVVVIQPQGEFEYLAYQADQKLTISVKRPAPVAAARKREAPSYTGQKLSLNFQDIDVRSVLQLIADFTGKNLVASDTVNGRITIRLQNVPWDQALDIILKTKGLDKRSNGSVIMIAPAEEIAAREKLEIQNTLQLEQVTPLRTEYIQLNYAKAGDVEKLLTSGRNNGGSGNTSGPSTTGTPGGLDLNANTGSLLSRRGTVSVDVRTNTLIIQDTAAKIDEIRDLIQKLDVPVRQVMIEARIVRASDNFSKELGVRWGVQSNGIASNRNLLVGGSETTLFDLRRPQSFDLNGQKGVSYTISRPDNLSVDLGTTGAGASRIAFGLLSMSDLMLDLELSALQADGKGEIVATPKVLTADKQKARIASGTQIPYQTRDDRGALTVAFQNAELSLEVTPSITPDNRVNMELSVNSDTPSTLQSNGLLAIDTNRVTTNVLIDDGQTVVLGGIFQNQTNNAVTKTPFLGDLPYVGRLFKRDVKSNNKQELLIFVTPRLVTNSAYGNNRR